MTGLNPPLSLLIQSKDYRSFMKSIIEKDGKAEWGVYTALAKKAGFSSRSIVRDIISGKRRITAKTLSPLVSAMNLKGDSLQYFKLLVWKSEVDVRPPGANGVLIERRITRLKNKNSKPSLAGETKVKQLVAGPHWAEIYASLGTYEKGADPETIVRRSGLEMNSVLHLLNQMVNAKVVRRSECGQNYFPIDSHVVSSAFDLANKDFILRAADQVAKKARENFDRKDQLYWNSVFSVKREKAEAFKEELKELLIKFVDYVEDPDGSTIGDIFVAFHLRK